MAYSETGRRHYKEFKVTVYLGGEEGEENISSFILSILQDFLMCSLRFSEPVHLVVTQSHESVLQVLQLPLGLDFKQG